MQRALTSTFRPRSMFGVATRLALLLSMVAAVAVIALDPIGEVTRDLVVVGVAAVGFAASWVMTGRVQSAPPARHRVAVIPIAQRVS